MGIGLRWISVALEAFDFELAAMVADGVIDKIEDVVESKKMKTKHKQGMLTETELTSVIDNGELLIINNYEVDTISIYTSNNSSFNILGRDGTNRYTIKGKNKLREIQFHTRLKKDSNGKKQNKEIGIVEQKRSSREKLSIVLLDNLLTDIWINDEKNICFSDSQWMIIKYEESFSYSICLNGTELATVTKVINDCENAIKGYKHALKIYHDDYEYECVLLFVAVTLLENSHLFNEPFVQSKVIDKVLNREKKAEPKAQQAMEYDTVSVQNVLCGANSIANEAASSKRMLCPNCGAPVGTGNFCTHCGTCLKK